MSTVLLCVQIYLKKLSAVCAAEPSTAVIYLCILVAFTAAVGDMFGGENRILCTKRQFVLMKDILRCWCFIGLIFLHSLLSPVLLFLFTLYDMTAMMGLEQ